MTQEIIRKLVDTVNTLSISDESIDALNVRGLLERLAVVLTCRFVFQNLLNVTIIRTSKHQRMLQKVIRKLSDKTCYVLWNVCPSQHKLRFLANEISRQRVNEEVFKTQFCLRSTVFLKDFVHHCIFICLAKLSLNIFFVKLKWILALLYNQSKV